MSEQDTLFETKPEGKHADLLRRRTRPEDFRRRVAAVLRAFEPIGTDETKAKSDPIALRGAGGIALLGPSYKKTIEGEVVAIFN